MNFYKNIHEVATLYKLPVSTLHYWEKEGLFETQRNQENQYRLFSLADIMNVWEIVFYREMHIPVKEIRKLIHDDIDAIENCYDEQEKTLQEQLRRTQEILARLERQKEMIRRIRSLRESPLRESVPDIAFCCRDPFDLSSIQASLENTYDICLWIGGPHHGQAERGIFLADSDAEVIWQRKDTGKYLEFLLKAGSEDPEENDLQDTLTQVRSMGLRPGTVIGRYLMMGSEDGKRYEYYRAWIEVT